MIHVILGAPCSGKSTYVRENAKSGDVIVDYDAIARALGAESHMPDGAIKQAAFEARKSVIDYCIKSNCEAWIIHTTPSDEQRETYEKVGAEFIEMDTDLDTCLERAERDGRPPGTEQVIRDYFASSKGGVMKLKTKTVDVKADSGSIKGYAATWTREPDSYGDVIAKGAFTDSIAEIESSGNHIPLLWNHDSGDLKSYIGTVTRLEEDEHGLMFEADFDSTEEAQRARELASDGRLCKFSFAYDVIDQATVELEDGTEANELRKLNIHEVSLVMYPANRDTSVIEVKSSPEVKAGRRNSAKDADKMREVLEHCSALKEHYSAVEEHYSAVEEHYSAIESIVNGLLADKREEPNDQEADDEKDAAEVNAEEPDAVNAEERKAKSDELAALLDKASSLLEEEV